MRVKQTLKQKCFFGCGCYQPITLDVLVQFYLVCMVGISNMILLNIYVICFCTSWTGQIHEVI